MILFTLTTAFLVIAIISRLYDCQERIAELEARLRGAETDINNIGRYVFEGADPREYTVTGGIGLTGSYLGMPSVTNNGITMVSEGGDPNDRGC